MRRAWIAMAGLVAACGFAPQDDFSGRRVGEGIAPWSDVGGLRLCLGTNLVGAPASAASGLCDAPGSPNAPCLSDGDCRSRESCVCGGCTVQFCSANSDCGAGRVCTFGGINGNRCDTPCATSADCAGGEFCQASRCIARCATDDDCQSGEFCATVGLDRVCAVRPCEDDTSCTDGRLCRIQRKPRVATEPSAIEVDGQLVLYLELSDEFQQDQRAIYRAVSDDGVSFRMDPATPVIEDADTAHAPSAVRADGMVWVYYESGDGAALRATSSVDGISFGPAATVLEGMPGAVHRPGVAIMPDGQIGVFYEVGDGAAIAFGRGAAGQALATEGTVLAPADVEDPGTGAASQFWIEIDRVGSPHAAVVEDAAGQQTLRVWFTAFGRESGDTIQLGEVMPVPPNFSIGFASGPADDPGALRVWPFNPVFDRISVFVDHLSELAPAVVQVGPERFLMYYLAADPAGGELGTIGVATNGE